VLDENNRLIEYNKHSYVYDKADNPTKIEGEAGYSYNTADELKEGPTAKYTYNEDGQRTKLEPKSGEPATAYGYDQAGHLTSTEREKGPKQTELDESTTFDGNGLSQEITVNGAKNRAAWDTAEPLPIILEDETGGGEEEASYIYGPENLPIEESFGLNGIYLHHDQQGSTRVATYWQEGEVVGWKTFGPFGNTIEAAGDATGLGYDGQPTDPETGLIWLGARRYDSNTAQFMSIDPAIESTGEAYTYVRDDPENGSDLTGACAAPTLPVINWTKVVEGCIKGGTKGFIVATVTGQVEAIPTTVVIGCLTGAVFKLWDQLADNEPGITGQFSHALATALEFITGDAHDGEEIIQEAPTVLSSVWNFWESDWLRWFWTLGS
jgi:RHS repeat-associated protein